MVDAGRAQRRCMHFDMVHGASSDRENGTKRDAKTRKKKNRDDKSTLMTHGIGMVDAGVAGSPARLA